MRVERAWRKRTRRVPDGHACDLVCSPEPPILFTRGKAEGHRGQVTLLVRGGAGQPRSTAQASPGKPQLGPGPMKLPAPPPSTLTPPFSRCEISCRENPDRLSSAAGFSFWSVSAASLLESERENLGSGHCIPLSLIKMQICTVHEEGNLEAFLPVTRTLISFSLLCW